MRDIHHFVLGRVPKFELVYDAWTSDPVLQFSLGTDLSRAEIEARFPAPKALRSPSWRRGIARTHKNTFRN